VLAATRQGAEAVGERVGEATCIRRDLRPDTRASAGIPGASMENLGASGINLESGVRDFCGCEPVFSTHCASKLW
jgi:hypothetical protein